MQWGFEVGAAALGWIPWVGGWAGGLLMDAYNFGQSLVASGVYNFTDWLRGDGGIIQNLADFGTDAVLAVAWLGIDIVGTFIPLPPIPLPPRPPLQGPYLASTLAAPTMALESAGPLSSLTDALSKARNDFATAVKSLTEGTGLATLADRIKEQATVNEKTPIVEGTVEKAVEGTVETIKETSDGLTNSLDETVTGVVSTVDQQTKQSTDEISVVPRSVRQSLQDAVPATTVADAQDTAETVKTAAGEAETVKTPARSVRQGAREAVGKTATDAKAVADNARDAVKTAVKNLTPKPKVKKDKSVSSPEAKQPKGSDGAHDKGASKKDNKK